MTLRIIFGLVIIPILLQANTPTKKSNPKYSIDGYIKYLLTVDFSEGADDITTDNLLHHRFNLKWYPHKTITIAADIRNRIHFGELVKTTNTAAPDLFGKLIDTNNDVVDMSFFIVEKRSLVWHTMVDRLYFNWSKDKFDITVGRQRINWGINLVWNPNDIFNTYSFFDFDYEERPGSDAVRFVYYQGYASSLELAIKTTGDKDKMVAALLYKWNKANYDFQVLGGYAKRDITLGGGWAGNIKNAGFKGEFNYFHPSENVFDTTGVFVGTLSFDYSFKNSLYLNSSFLYASNGSASSSFSYLESLNFSAKKLSIYKYNFFTQVYYPFTPILTGTIATIYSPGKNHGLFIGPILTYSIKENWDLDAVAQFFFANENGFYEAIAELFFLRIKWSY